MVRHHIDDEVDAGASQYLAHVSTLGVSTQATAAAAAAVRRQIARSQEQDIAEVWGPAGVADVERLRPKVVHA